jgi:intracellular multiplication protein IcmL
MDMSNPRQQQPDTSNQFYINYYQTFFVIFIVAIFLALILVGVLLYQVSHRPLPVYTAIGPKGQTLRLTPEEEPNLLPPTLIKWASKAAVAAYTFDFVNYDKELSASRPYFTEAGWENYKASIANAVKTVRQNQLFVSGVVVGAPVIANQGDLPGRGYVWRIQLPFLVTYQSAESVSRRFYTVVLTVVRVPTWINSTAIGIDQFVMEE